MQHRSTSGSATSVTVEQLGAIGATPLSAGGTLRLEEPVIDQNGVLPAPFGPIELTATDWLGLGAGSVTSVSGGGVFVPYGTLTSVRCTVLGWVLRFRHSSDP